MRRPWHTLFLVDRFPVRSYDGWSSAGSLRYQERHAMSKAITAAALSLLTLSVCVHAWAQGEFPLRYEQTNDARNPLIRMSRRSFRAENAKPPELKGVPSGLSKNVSYLVIPVGESNVLALVDKSSPARLFIDTNGDEDLSDEKPIRLDGDTSTGGTASTVIRLEKTGKGVLGGNIKVDWYGNYLAIGPAGLVSGTVELGGEAFRVALVDNNFDGRYDGVVSFPMSFSSHPPFDWFAIDLNGDGEFDRSILETGEILLLPKMIQVKGVYYDVEVVPDGTAIRFEKVTPALGRLDVGLPAPELTLFSDSGLHRLTGSEGHWELPAGKYVLVATKLSRKDESGDSWTLRSAMRSGNPKNFEIHKDMPLRLKAGEPLLAKANVSRQGNVVSAGFSLEGAGGEEYGPAAEKNGTQQHPPMLKIVDQGGQVLETGPFNYG